MVFVCYDFTYPSSQTEWDKREKKDVLCCFILLIINCMYFFWDSKTSIQVFSLKLNISSRRTCETFLYIIYKAGKGCIASSFWAYWVDEAPWALNENHVNVFLLEHHSTASISCCISIWYTCYYCLLSSCIFHVRLSKGSSLLVFSIPFPCK